MLSHNRKTLFKRFLDEGIHAAAQPLGPERGSFLRLVAAVRSSSALLKPVETRRPDFRGVVRALTRLAAVEPNWRRSPESWSARHASRFEQFRSLVHHLLVAYSVPSFMAGVWLQEGPSRQDETLFLHLARGLSIRRFPTPVRLDRRMAKEFLHAPDDLTVSRALRWAQVRGLGGDASLARTVTETLLAVPTTDEPFWESVIRFLVGNSPLAADETKAIVAFIDQQRFQPAERVWGRGAGPLQPEFMVQGRTLQSLRRHMTHWRSEVQARRNLCCRESHWPPTAIGSFTLAEGPRIWTIEELLTDRELRVEGGILQHCVASYRQRCARRRTSIWSMKVHEEGRAKRVLTIEVDPEDKRVWQAKGKRNAPPDDEAWRILQRWAIAEGLVLRQRR